MTGKGILRCSLIGATLSMLFCEPAHGLATRPARPSAQLVVRSSPDAALASALTLDSKTWNDALAAGAAQPEEYAPVSDVYLTVKDKTYMIDPSYRLYDPANAMAIQLRGETKRQLIAHAAALKSKHYGKLLAWPEAKEIVTMKSIFTVVDLESGLRFEVQRRAGSTHADVQPLTKRDTDVMKRIYEGKWSWRRRAVLVAKDGETIAASMHGMPHGGDGIPDNDFNGHFCIHFLGSSTHKTGSVDPDHQTMVHKAAGKLPQYMRQASPENVAELFFIAINQRDPELMAALFPYRNHDQLTRLKQEAASVIAIRRTSDYAEAASGDLLAVDLPARAVIYRDGFRKAENTFVFHLRRSSIGEAWKIDYVENAL
ncbi:hypothetical protein [Paenibacillus glycinis]|uniref:Uncharacterized protein n=1 Tax=Paenibacillus glycinis TaxID=2697035 RepID=A0ABW9XQD5_9BACL|nr:hypothetical protein [Paenibacillus glycinis]NBD24853.1 hypothetical protein [Paenibacillus glycinis]